MNFYIGVRVDFRFDIDFLKSIMQLAPGYEKKFNF